MKAKTFDEWKDAGFRVRKGEKATGRDFKTGKATFDLSRCRHAASPALIPSSLGFRQ